jgi:hypothetical protein
MIITTHALVTIGVGKALGLQSLWDWFLAFLFGVLVDLDHLKVFRLKYRQNGDWVKFFTREWPVRTFIQEPISILWVVPLSFYLQTPVPMIFWSLHVFMDYLVDGARKPFWPFSNIVFKKGILSSFGWWEWLLVPVAVLVFTSRFVLQ